MISYIAAVGVKIALNKYIWLFYHKGNPAEGGDARGKGAERDLFHVLPQGQNEQRQWLE